MKKNNLLFIYLLLASSLNLHASQMDILESAQRKDLAQKPTWLRLLHYEKGKAPSAILTDDFFLSKKGKKNPYLELQATIEAYFQPLKNNPQEHAICQFPARYYWLNHHISLPDYQLKFNTCKKLRKWEFFESVESISLILVSGYLGSPASTFGHSLLKLNTKNNSKVNHDFFDLTLNFGALLPENENILTYIGKGIFGGYKAGFSDQYYYTQDIVYSHNEFRDMWDYQLNLTEYQRTLLILHIWEVLGKKFNYYFFDKNCAYRLGELLDVVLGSDLVNISRKWYSPVELFQRVEKYDNTRIKSNKKPLVSSVKYLPSQKRQLYQKIQLLSREELSLLNKVLKLDVNNLDLNFANLNQDRQIVIMDTLLDYFKYKLVSVGEQEKLKFREMKDAILLKRLTFPPRKETYNSIKELASPASGTKPMSIGLSYIDRNESTPYLGINWAPYKRDIVSKNSLEGDEFTILDFYFGYRPSSRSLFIDAIDFIRITDRNKLDIGIPNEKEWSWKLLAGIERIQNNNQSYYDGTIEFAAGDSWVINHNITASLLFGLEAHTQKPQIKLHPQINIDAAYDKLKLSILAGALSTDNSLKFKENFSIKGQYTFDRNFAATLSYSNEYDNKFAVGLSWFW